MIEGTGRIRVGDEVLTLEPLSSVLVTAEEVRQVFNDPTPTLSGSSSPPRRPR